MLGLLLGLGACGTATDWSQLSAQRLPQADAAVPAVAQPESAVAAAPADGFALCEAAVAGAERQERTPPGLLGAIARVETGRQDPGSHAVRPWPWSIDVDGQSRFFSTQAQAVAATREALLSRAASIDVGCLQVNLQYHPDAFRDLQEAFDPMANARYAARFLKTLWAGTAAPADAAGTADAARWRLAAGFYHSRTPELAEPYRRAVDGFARESCATPLPSPAALVQRRPDPLVVAAGMVLRPPPRPSLEQGRPCGTMTHG